MKDIVEVRSKTINNESVTVAFREVSVLQGGEKDKREISRSYIFNDFKAEIPFKLAQILIKQNPNEFSIIKSKDKKPTQEVERVVKVAEEKREGFVCPHCGLEAKSKAGLLAHIRIKHPEKWEGKKKK